MTNQWKAMPVNKKLKAGLDTATLNKPRPFIQIFRGQIPDIAQNDEKFTKSQSIVGAYAESVLLPPYNKTEEYSFQDKWPRQINLKQFQDSTP